MNLNASSDCFFSNPAEQVAQALVQQRFKISVRSAVGVELQEEIIANYRRKIEPLPRSIRLPPNRRPTGLWLEAVQDICRELRLQILRKLRLSNPGGVPRL